MKLAFIQSRVSLRPRVPTNTGPSVRGDHLMETRVGVGRSRSRNSSIAGSEAAQEALLALDGRAPNLVLAFGTAGHDQHALLRGIRDITGDAPLVGCSAEGIVTAHGSEEGSHAVAISAISSGELSFETFFEPHFAEDSALSGRELAARVTARGCRGGLLVLFPDGIGGNCRELIASIEAGLPQPPPMVLGGTAGDLLAFERTFQYCGEIVASGGLSALWIGGPIAPDVLVTHGCDLVGNERVVTRVDGCWVEEIDGRPAWDFFKEYLADGADTLEAMHVAHIMIAERVDGYDDAIDDFTVRVPVRLDVTRGALYFVAGIREGTRVQLAIRNPDKVCTRAVEGVARIVSRHPREQPLMVLDFECAGRGGILFGQGETSARLIAPMQRAFGKHIPWIGIHTYGEIAPVGGTTWFHNYTAVLCALYPSSAAGLQ